MRSFLILLKFLLVVPSYSLNASLSQNLDTFINDISSIIPVVRTCEYVPSHEDLKIEADDLFSRASSWHSYNPLEASELYGQAGNLYHQCLLLNSNKPSRLIYQSAILSSFRAGFYRQDYDPEATQKFFAYCYHTIKNYFSFFEQEISADDIGVLIMIFNKMASFFEKSELLSEKENIAHFYIEAGNLGMIAFNKRQMANKASPLDYGKPAIAYYNAAYTLKEINLALAYPLYEYSAHLHLIRTEYKGNQATENDLRLTSCALYNVVLWNNTFSDEQKFHRFKIILDLELRRFEKLRDKATPQDYDTIAKVYYNLGEQCSNAFAKLLQFQYLQKAAEFESIYLSQNSFNVSDHDLFQALHIYQKATETTQSRDQALAQIFHTQAQNLKLLLNQKQDCNLFSYKSA
ncbi:MAG: hypothetical protein BGO76_04535 [Caedibacter sp. 38-128]|nr:hypothetical protein [Holosporales bacterium]OJX04330.1 MAG: hypothetical protein BGO76_04535 [Caedibacter sp. 38-128]